MSPRAHEAQPPTIWERALYRWTAVTTVMAGLLVVYTSHPYYRGGQFASFRPFFTAAFVTWLVLGVFYVKASLERFPGPRFAMRDGALHLLALARPLGARRFWRLARRPRVRTTLLGIAVKAFFTPLMTGFFVGHVTALARGWLVRFHHAPFEVRVPEGASPLDAASAWWHQVGRRLPELVPSGHELAELVSRWSATDTDWALKLAYDLVFVVDCGWALVGYASESRFLGNKTRSVEPTGLGWVVCLGCYPPFNHVLGVYLPLRDGAALITSPTTLLWLRAAVVVLFAIYASATLAFGFKFSNLTNRGIVTRGPYRFVRHPAYLCKCAAWWLEHAPTMTPVKAFFLTLLCGVYALRAWTEERHLGRDPEYRAYKKKVPWLLVPRVY